MLKRLFDIFFSSVLLFIFIIPLAFIALLIKMTSKGPVLYWSTRIGKDNKIFLMPKFRTMNVGAPELPTHELKSAEQYLNKFGRILRKTSLDETPQLVSVLLGDMSIVGPRPALYNQNYLIEIRTQNGVHTLKPGLTGLAQISGRDTIDDEKKAFFDLQYKDQMNIFIDLKIIAYTFFKILKASDVAH